MTSNDLLRKAIHIFFGVFLSVVLLLTQNSIPLIAFYFVLLIGLCISFLEYKGFKIPIVNQFLTNLDKKTIIPGSGMIFYYLAFVLLVSLQRLLNLPLESVILPILILALADPTSYIVGKTLGKKKLPFSSQKTIAGTTSGILMAIIISSFFVTLSQSIVLGIVAMSADLLNIKIKNISLDDNLTIPLFAFIYLYFFIYT